jgi:hypothetical protein
MGAYSVVLLIDLSQRVFEKRLEHHRLLGVERSAEQVDRASHQPSALPKLERILANHRGTPKLQLQDEAAKVVARWGWAGCGRSSASSRSAASSSGSGSGRDFFDIVVRLRAISVIVACSRGCTHSGRLLRSPSVVRSQLSVPHAEE